MAQNKVDQVRYKTMNEKFFADYEAETLNISAYLAFSLSLLDNEFIGEIIQPLQLPKVTELIKKHRQAGVLLIK